jgi:hypothetical protein
VVASIDVEIESLQVVSGSEGSSLELGCYRVIARSRLVLLRMVTHGASLTILVRAYRSSETRKSQMRCHRSFEEIDAGPEQRK